MIVDKVVHGGPQLKTPGHNSFGKYVIDKLMNYGSIEEDKIAMINGDSNEELTYKELIKKIVNIATGLKKLGIKPGDVIAICSENSFEYIAAAVSIFSIGAALTTINMKYTKSEILHILNLSKPRLVFCSINALESKLNILQEVSFVEVVVQLSEKHPEEVPRGVLTLGDLVKEDYDVYDFEPVMVNGTMDNALVAYSSGTTGLPKAVMLTHLNALYASMIFNYSSANNARVLTVAPWYHVYGLFTTIQYICTGNKVVYLTEFVPEQYLKTIEKYKISEILTVPSIIVTLGKSELVKCYDLSSINLVWCAAAPLSANTISLALKNLPNCNKLLQAYGMTETTLTILKEPEDRPGTPGSCGQPLPGVKAKVLDVTTREKLGPNEEGEICIKSPTLMKGYLNNEDATKKMFDEEGYIMTGDKGYYDNEGRFYVVDRIKDILKYKGQQVAPALIESVVLQHPGVAECGVVGKPDELAGDLPTAFVVNKAGYTLTEQDILDFTSPKLSPMSRLRGGVVFVQEMPRNGSGKILRRKLQEILNKMNENMLN